jgi:voltage-dependent potassium channel beta subunit
MEYRRLGDSGLRVSEIALGSWLTFGDSVDLAGTTACVRAALDCGVNFLDTADVYNHGEAEKALGTTVKRLGLRRQDLVISSKVFWPMSEDVNDRGLSRKHIMESIDASLHRLGTDYLDIYFCHRYDPSTPVEEVVRAMDDVVHQGKALYWGTSVWPAAKIEQAVGIARQTNCYQPRVEQPRYNLLDRHVEPEILPTCASHGMGVTVYSPLSQGVLTGKYNDGIPTGSRGERGGEIEALLTEKNIAQARRLTQLARDLNLEPSQLALAWVLRRPEVSTVIVGATRPEHISSAVKASGATLTDAVLERIETILM